MRSSSPRSPSSSPSRMSNDTELITEVAVEVLAVAGAFRASQALITDHFPCRSPVAREAQFRLLRAVIPAISPEVAWHPPTTLRCGPPGRWLGEGGLRLRARPLIAL